MVNLRVEILAVLNSFAATDDTNSKGT